MIEKIEIVDGTLKITSMPISTVEVLTKEEITNRRAEAQTKIDHLKIDLATAQLKVTVLDNYLQEIAK